MDHLEDVQTNFVSTVTKGIRFSFSKLDATSEPNFAKIFNLEGDQHALVVLNAGKRKRFLVHDGDMNASAL